LTNFQEYLGNILKGGFSVLYRKWICTILCFILILPFVPEKTSANMAIIQANMVNVRKGPGLIYNVIKQVKKGERYSIIERKNDWVKLKLPGNDTGWVASWLISEEKAKTISSTEPSHQVQSNVDGLRIRSGPGINFQIIGFLNKGQQAKYIEKNENWTKIYHNGQYGWVSSSYISFSNTASAEKQQNLNRIGRVTASSLNVRIEPSLQAKIIGSLKNGTKVDVTGEREDWLQIAFNGNRAWVSRQFIEMINAGKENSEQTPPSENKNNFKQHPITATITAAVLNVRNEGSLNGTIIGKITKGQQVTILEESNQWCKIQRGNKETGWVACWYLNVEEKVPANDNGNHSSAVKILYNGTNIRSGPSTNASIMLRANEGETFPVLSKEGDWYSIQLPNQKTGYVAGWIVEVRGNIAKVERSGANQYLKDKVIIIDPGHGGRDSGAVGMRGTLEKDLTLRTANLVYDKLKASGAKVILTRASDVYVSLHSRVSTSHYHKADAFISIHYDSSVDRTAHGITTYYYRQKDMRLAENVHPQLLQNTNMKDRGIRYGNFHVLRENKQTAVLLELGFLSNSTEEYTLISKNYQEKVSNAIYYGLAQYFKNG
jgi:N-acetylmuramoyl-L-alanine amidase